MALGPKHPKQMLSWSNTAYKFTLGIGSLAVAAMLADLTQAKLPAWIAIAAELLPFALFVFVRPEELPARAVRIVHVVASVWYMIATVGLLIMLAMSQLLPKGWPVYVVAALAGGVPCIMVLFKALMGTYGSSEIEHDRLA